MTTRIPKEHEDAMIAAYLNGATQEQAAALFDYGRKTCARILKQRGIPIRSIVEVCRIPKEHEDAMIAAYLAGVTQGEAAAFFGYNGTTCSNVLKRRKIPMRTASEAHRIPKEREDIMIAAYLKGATQEEAARPFGHDTDTFLRVLRRRGIVPRNSGELQRMPIEHEDAMIAAYLAGSTSKQAGALFGYSGRTCLNVLRRRGIKPRSTSEAMRKVTREQEEIILAAYLSGASAEEAAALCGYHKQVCAHILKRHGLTVRSFSEIHRRYTVDESFFDQIDTEEKAYWLGFLTADGAVVENSIVLALKQGDTEHLHKFAASLQSEHPISFRENSHWGKKTSQARIAIGSSRLVEALARLGVTPNKTFTVCPCEQVPEALYAAYWRGVFDGDGCITRFKDAKTGFRWSLCLCGNLMMVSGFREFVATAVPTQVKILPEGKIFRIQYSGKSSSYTVAQILYRGATIYLDRKYALAKQLCGDLLS